MPFRQGSCTALIPPAQSWFCTVWAPAPQADPDLQPGQVGDGLRQQSRQSQSSGSSRRFISKGSLFLLGPAAEGAGGRQRLVEDEDDGSHSRAQASPRAGSKSPVQCREMMRLSPELSQAAFAHQIPLEQPSEPACSPWAAFPQVQSILHSQDQCLPYGT